MKLVPVIASGLAYFVLGGLWFTPLFGKQWDRALGFTRPAKWRPGAGYYIAPLLGCLIAAGTLATLVRWTQAVTLEQHLLVGLTVGLGYGAAITGINAYAPNMPRPGLYALVVGSYHLAGLLLAAGVLHGLA